MEVRRLTADEIGKLMPLANLFFGESAFLVDFNEKHFEAQWRRFMDSGSGLIMVLDDGGEIRGAIGALAYTDPNNGHPTMAEAFWYVHPDHRGHGLALLTALEKEAAAAGCKFLTMVYLVDSMPDAVRSIYERRGYKAMEVHYIKEVQ